MKKSSHSVAGFSAKPVAAPLALAVLSAISTLSAAEPVQSVEPVVVTATRVSQPLSEAASSLTVVSEKEIAQTQPLTFAELLDTIPNVDTTSSNSVMFNRVSIRGSQPNQITYLIDGMRQDDMTMGGNRPMGVFADTEILKQVEVRNGGGSALYGNGGIGGTLALETKSAADFLADSDKDFGALFKVGYGSDSISWSKSAYAFGRSDMWDVVAGVTRRDSGAVKTSYKGKRSTADVDNDSTSVFVKATLAPTDNNAVTLSYAYDIAHNDSEKEASFDSYRYEQHRIIGQWEYESGELVNLKAGLQYAQSKFHFENDVPRNFKDKFDSVSGNFQNTSRFEGFGRHELTYGFDFSRTEQSGLTKDSGEWADDTSRPDAEGLDAGIFIEDQYKLTNYLAIAPQLRWSYFKRKSNADYPSLSDSKLTPGVTVKLTPMEEVMFWGSVTTGYRPPILDEMYYRMDYSSRGFQSVVIPNPDLKPEKSVNYEVGTSLDFKNLAGVGDRFTARAAVFYDDVKDFINVEMDPDFSGSVPVFTYRAENLGHVVNKGVELSASYAIDSFKVSATYGYIKSVNKETNERVTGVTPQSANLRTSYKFEAVQLEPWYKLHCAKGGWTSQDEYQGGYATHSVGLTWTPKIPNFYTVRAGIAVDNLTNKKYVSVTDSYGYARSFRAWLSAQF